MNLLRRHGRQLLKEKMRAPKKARRSGELIANFRALPLSSAHPPPATPPFCTLLNWPRAHTYGRQCALLLRCSANFSSRSPERHDGRVASLESCQVDRPGISRPALSSFDYFVHPLYPRLPSFYEDLSQTERIACPSCHAPSGPTALTAHLTVGRYSSGQNEGTMRRTFRR